MGHLVLEERLKNYIPTVRGKIKKLRGWCDSTFAGMTWVEVHSAVRSNSNLLALLDEIATTHKYDPAILLCWMELLGGFVTKHFYLARMSSSEYKDVARCTFTDESNLKFILMDETDLRTLALCEAFWTFRKEWFTNLGPPNFTPLLRKREIWITVELIGLRVFLMEREKIRPYKNYGSLFTSRVWVRYNAFQLFLFRKYRHMASEE